MKRFLTFSLLFTLAFIAGCGGEPATHAVSGRIVQADGDVARLADSHVEFELETDRTVRADGLIQSDGTFQVQSLRKGEVLGGAPAGRYRVRLVLNTDDGRLIRTPPIGQRFLNFNTSGLRVEVPAAEDVTLSLSRR